MTARRDSIAGDDGTSPTRQQMDRIRRRLFVAKLVFGLVVVVSLIRVLSFLL